MRAPAALTHNTVSVCPSLLLLPLLFSLTRASQGRSKDCSEQGSALLFNATVNSDVTSITFPASDVNLTTHVYFARVAIRTGAGAGVLSAPAELYDFCSNSRTSIRVSALPCFPVTEEVCTAPACPSLDPPLAGEWIISNTQYPGTAQLKCSDFAQVVGGPVVPCFLNGTWRQPLPSCITCPEGCVVCLCVCVRVRVCAFVCLSVRVRVCGSHTTCLSLRALCREFLVGNETRCEALRDCHPGEFETLAPTSSSDRRCTGCEQGSFSNQV